MAKSRLPEGYKGVDKLIEEFRKENPKGKIETSPVLLGDGFVIITAKVTKDDGAIGSGMADADVQDDKSVEKAESGAIRRALLTLGFKSLELEDDEQESTPKRSFGRSEEKSEKRFESRGLKRQADEKDSESDDEADDQPEESEKEDKPKSRFGNKLNDKAVADEEPATEGESKFKRGSRFQRS